MPIKSTIKINGRIYHLGGLYYDTKQARKQAAVLRRIKGTSSVRIIPDKRKYSTAYVVYYALK